MFHGAHCLPWSSLAMLRQFRVLVLNAGAHRVPVEHYRGQMRKLGHLIRAFLDGRASEGGRGARVYFRTTVPGFSDCDGTRHIAPHRTVGEAETFLRAHSYYQQHEFVPEANRIAINETMQAGARILDVYPSSILRVDDRAGRSMGGSGIDCLHYRQPFLNTSLGGWARLLGESLHDIVLPISGAQG